MKWIVGLNSMRLFAIILILIYHLYATALPGGFIAVEIFLALTGFLITSKLLNEYRTKEQISYWKFIKERLDRLYPALIACILVTFSIACFANSDVLAGARIRTLAAGTFTTNILELVTGGNYENAIAPNLFEHTWFLALEMQFLIVLPLAMKLIMGYATNLRRSVKNLALAFGVTAFVSAGLMLIYGAVYELPNRAYFGLDSHMTALCLGGLLACLNFLYPRTPRTLKLYPTLALVISAVITVVFSTKLSFDDFRTYAFVLSFVAIISTISIFAIIKLQSNSGKEQKLPKLLRALEYLGSLSFGIYLYHWPLFILLPQILPETTPAWLYPIVNIILSIILSIVTDFARIKKAKKPVKIIATILAGICALATIYGLIIAPAKSSVSEQLESIEDISVAANVAGELPITTLQENISNSFSALIDAAAHDPIRYKQPAKDANSAKVLVIGDSVTLGAKKDMEDIIPGVFVNAKESRGIETAKQIIRQYASTGNLPPVIVISLATNFRNITEQTFQEILDAAGPNHRFVLVTAYAGVSQPREKQNAVIKSFASKHEDVFVADWWAVAHNNWSLLYSDHIHLNFDGRPTYAKLIYRAVREASGD